MKRALPNRGWNSGTWQRAVNRALALAVLIVPIVVVTQSVQAQSFSVLYSFNAADGLNPKSGLVRDNEGNLYGTTSYGGASHGGTVFKLDTAGRETVLHTFTGPDGIGPSSGLVRDKEGNLYGTTSGGGASGQGIVFKLDTTGTETVLHSFTGPDGANPIAGLIRDEAGNLYGTTAFGGFLNCAGTGCGVVFKLDPAGNETVLHSFTWPDGAFPVAGLVQDNEGNLYGTTQGGGAFNEGTVFKLDTAGLVTVLHSFTGGTDGAIPQEAGLVQDKAGNLYGTTSLGGNLGCYAPSGCGVVFKLDPAGAETVLHRFTWLGGVFPFAGLVQDKAGNLYGTTTDGGASGFGTVFTLAP